MAKISKKAFRAQYEKYKMLDIRASMAAQELGRMASLILEKDVDAYRCAGGEFLVSDMLNKIKSNYDVQY